MLDALQAFDSAPASPVAGVTLRSAETGQQPSQSEQPPAAARELTSWALTNALLQFHLDRLDATGSTEGPADLYAANVALAAIGTTGGQQPFAPSIFGAGAQSMPTFSGLQEGFIRLA